MKKKAVTVGMALILTLGVGGFTAFASEIEMGGFANGNPSLCRGDEGPGGGGPPLPQPVPGGPDIPVPEI